MEAGVRLLGHPEARVGESWIPLRPARPEAVLAFLARRGGPVRRAELAAVLWPDSDESRASGSLRQALRALSRGPFGQLLGRDRSRAWSRVDSDVLLFETALRDGRWRDALEAYRGEFLEGFELHDAGEFGSWVESERAATAERWRQACVALIEEAHARADHLEALRLSDLVVGADPLDEVVLRLGLRAAAGLADRVGARRRFEAFRAVLEREVGMQPETATVAMAEAAATVELRSGAAEPTEHLTSGDSRSTAAASQDLVLRGAARRVVGRAAALAELFEVLVRQEAPLVTLLAPGGMGKTTLAAAFGEVSAEHFPDGVVSVNLEGVDDPHRVPAAVAEAAGVQPAPDLPLTPQLVAALAPRRSLLVLDAFERHLEAVSFVDALVRASGPLRTLITSRQRLRHSLETVLDVAPLATLPEGPSKDTSVHSAPSDAARLFLLNAAHHASSPTKTDDEVAIVERLCRKLGGSPLAIGLAAAWIDLVPLDELERSAERGWELLTSDVVDQAPRHADVRSIVAETWRQLDAVDRAAWARLSVMPGTLDPGVAAEVAGTGWRGLRRLLDRAVLRRVSGRLEMHALLALYGREQASLTGEDARAWDAVTKVWREHAGTDVDPVTGRYRRLVGDDLSQAVGVWRRALELRDWRTVGTLLTAVLRGLRRTARYREAESLIETTSEALERSRGPARDVAMARLLPRRRTPDSAARRANVQRALGLAERRQDDLARAEALWALLASEPGDDDGRRFEQARAAREAAGDLVGLAEMLADRSFELALLGWDQASMALAEESVAISRRIGDRLGEAHAIDTGITVPLMHGDADTVRRGIAEAAALFEQERGSQLSVITLATEAWLSTVLDDYERAQRYAEAFVQANAAYVEDVGDFEATMFIVHADREGDHEAALRYGRRLLGNRDRGDRPSPFDALADAYMVNAHLARGEFEDALAHARAIVNAARVLRGPRVIAAALAACGRAAVAMGEHELGLNLLREAWRQPAFDTRPRHELLRWLQRHAVDAEAVTSTADQPPEDHSAATTLAEAALERLLKR